MDKTNLGDRIKGYEAAAETQLIPRLPIVVRLDGRSFSKFTKGMQRPFDKEFRQAMIETTKYLVEQTNAKIGYTQSDEISLVLYSDNEQNGTTLFNGRVQKITSNLASMASVKFLLEMQKRFPSKVSNGNNLPSFDCRAFIVPSKTEAMNSITWRVQDCIKNSISMVAHYYFSHKSLQGMSGEEKINKLATEKGVDWHQFSHNEKQGTFVRKEKAEVQLSEERLSKIPADKQPKNGIVQRNVIVEMDMPNFLELENRTEVIFECAEPI